MSSYHVSLSEAMKLTLPQILMLNHAAWVNYERAKQRSEDKPEGEAAYQGKPLEECNSDEWTAYMKDWAGMA